MAEFKAYSGIAGSKVNSNYNQFLNRPYFPTFKEFLMSKGTFKMLKGNHSGVGDTNFYTVPKGFNFIITFINHHFALDGITSGTGVHNSHIYIKEGSGVLGFLSQFYFHTGDTKITKHMAVSVDGILPMLQRQSIILGCTSQNSTNQCAIAGYLIPAAHFSL